MLIPLRYQGRPAAESGQVPKAGRQTLTSAAVAASEPAPPYRPASGVAADGVTVRRAEIRDMRAIAPLITRFADRNLMLAKSHDQLVRSFREFLVASDEADRIVGCGALRIYSEELAEVISLAVDESFQGAGIGRRIVHGLVDQAILLGIGSVFALTLQERFFHRLGFNTVPKDLFPLKVWADCRACPKLHACDEIAVVKKLF